MNWQQIFVNLGEELQISELQLALIAAGAFLVVAMVVYNRVQMRRVRRVAPEGGERAAQAESGAKLPQGREMRVEPSLEGWLDDGREAASAGAAKIVPQQSDVTIGATLGIPEQTSIGPTIPQAPSPSQGGVEAIVVEPSVPPLPSVPLPSRSVIDPLIDCIVTVRLDQAVSGDRVLAASLGLRQIRSRPLHIEGLRVAGRNWEAAIGDEMYAEIQVAIQLANRSGMLSALEFSTLLGAAQQLADALDGHLDAPDMNETVARARELDEFASQYDVQLALHVVSDGAPWAATYVQSIATRDELVLSRDGTRFARFASVMLENDRLEPRPVFTLQFADTNFLRDDLTMKSASRITLMLDLPQVPEALAPFRMMADYAHRLAQTMGGQVMDDNQRSVPEATLANIEKQLASLYMQLDAHGLNAGSVAARRLFSR